MEAVGFHWKFGVSIDAKNIEKKTPAHKNKRMGKY
jgi:hypothetical protein